MNDYDILNGEFIKIVKKLLIKNINEYDYRILKNENKIQDFLQFSNFNNFIVFLNNNFNITTFTKKIKLEDIQEFFEILENFSFPYKKGDFFQWLFNDNLLYIEKILYIMYNELEPFIFNLLNIEDLKNINKKDFIQKIKYL